MSTPFVDLTIVARASAPWSDEDFDYIPWWTTDTMSSVLDDLDTETWCMLCDLIAGTAATIRHESPRTIAAILTAVMEALWMRQPIRHTTMPADRQIPDRFAPLTRPEPDIRELSRIGAAWCLARLAAFTRHRPFPSRGCHHHRLDEIAADARRILADDDGSWLYTGPMAARRPRTALRHNGIHRREAGAIPPPRDDCEFVTEPGRNSRTADGAFERPWETELELAQFSP
ncbi:hypothetical protein [Nocardia pseudovaccinii]|uniref:hypothetical protein n=1 Tax=Nocardia pseudovaccinii TaxID=189540 RepID=UPI0007A3B69E|nr:hypothetical protein [Nocardia pseudovaccinii]